MTEIETLCLICLSRTIHKNIEVNEAIIHHISKFNQIINMVKQPINNICKFPSTKSKKNQWKNETISLKLTYLSRHGKQNSTKCPKTLHHITLQFKKWQCTTPKAHRTTFTLRSLSTSPHS